MVLREAKLPVYTDLKKKPALWFSHGTIKISYPSGKVELLTDSAHWLNSQYTGYLEDLLEDCEFISFIE